MYKVVYSHMSFAGVPESVAKGLDKMLFASLSSYFSVGNTDGVVVVTNSIVTKQLVNQVAGKKRWNVSVELVNLDDVVSEPLFSGFPKFRYNTTAAKLYALMYASGDDDILLCDCDTIWCDKIDWAAFNQYEMCVFRPKAWNHPMSTTIGQMFYWNAIHAKTEFREFIGMCINDCPHWRLEPQNLKDLWINGGHIFMTSAYRHEMLPLSITNCTQLFTTTCEEIFLFNALISSGNDDFAPSRNVGISDYGLNTPMPFFNLVDELDTFKPNGVVSLHYFVKPKPNLFQISYDGIIKNCEVINGWDLNMYDETLRDLGFYSLNGKLGTYLWYYYFMDSANCYLDGERNPIFPTTAIKRVINSFHKSRRDWENCNSAIDSYVERVDKLSNG